MPPRRPTFVATEATLTRARVPKISWSGFAGLPVAADGWDKGATDAVLEYYEHFNTRDGVGITLMGPTGVGKTHLASALLAELLGRGNSGRFVEASKFMTWHYRALSLSALWRKYDRIDAVAEWEEIDEVLQWLHHTAQVVMLDDVGHEHTTDYSVDVMSALLRERFRRRLPTIITTNLSPDDFNDSYDAAFGDFLHEAAPIQKMTGRSRRDRAV